MKWQQFLRIAFSLFLLIFYHASSATELYVRGSILHFLSDPDKKTADPSYQYIDDGLLIIKNGKISWVGPWISLKDKLPKNVKITRYQNGLIVPGFIDVHTHYTQIDVIAVNSGGHLLQWLEQYVFPAEAKFKNQQYAQNAANFFIEELLRNGTTSALIFTTSFPNAVDSLFEAAEKKHMLIISGLVVNDKNMPADLTQSPDKAAEETEQLILKWHKKPNTRLLYAITPLYAPSTSPYLFKKIEALKAKYPDVHIHTHISETEDEVKWVKQLFNAPYLSVYDQYHLLGPKTLLAHGIYLTDAEEKRMHDTKTAVGFCPTSNLFLGSGLFNLAKAEKNGVTVGLCTDVGAGTSFSLLQTMGEAYKVLQLQDQILSPFEAFYLATLGGAKALNIDDKVGNFNPGKDADFIVLNLSGPTPLLKRRFSYSKTLSDKLFILMTLGDDRSIIATYVDGALQYKKES
jgi:guanine deaminase